MGKEIERKFLVQSNDWSQDTKFFYRQGYLSTNPERVVRVRTVDEKGFLTVKGKSSGMTRLEFEYEIPFEDAKELLDTLCKKPLIEKTRYLVPIENVVFEVDKFLGENKGLVIAEVELEHENQSFPRPDWLGQEVTTDFRYSNSNLIKTPYSKWKG